MENNGVKYPENDLQVYKDWLKSNTPIKNK